MEKDGLPQYSRIDELAVKLRRRVRRSRALKLVALGCLVFVAYAQWLQLGRTPVPAPGGHARPLSLERLREDLTTCAKLQSKPTDPSGPREKNARYVDGHKPTLIRNATIWTGEPAEGTSAEEARAGNGYAWIKADVFLQYGLIQKVEPDLQLSSFPEDSLVFDAGGRQLTAGIIDMHSHAGVDSLPDLRGGEDTNELSSDITPYVRSIDGLNPLDHQIQVIKSGGVTTSLILPGSGNNMGGEAFVIKHAVGKADGRSQISNEDMLADPDRNWRYMKMACGENPKRIYGQTGRDFGPYSRLGEAWYFRHAFEQATKLVKAQDDWCSAASTYGVEAMDSYLPQELEWESLGAALRGQVHINTHCYTIADLEAFVRHTNEFKFSVRAFHHAHQTYLVPEVLKRAWGGHPPAAALFADNMYYKTEAYIGSEQAGKILYENGLTPVFVSDNPVLNAQHVVFEAAKAYQYGLPYHAALAGVTTAPAELLGLQERIGKVKPGFDADLVVWDDDPLAVAATPIQVWIDGAEQFPDAFTYDKPVKEPIKPDVSLATTLENVSTISDIIFTGVNSVLVPGSEYDPSTDDSSINVVVSNGKIVCQGLCESYITSSSSSSIKTINLSNGYLTPSFLAFGSTLGIEEIAGEPSTQDGSNDNSAFSLAIDGLVLSNKNLAASFAHGVTRAISAPKYSRGGHKGVSVGFRTGALHASEENAIFAEEVGLHYTLTQSAKQGDTPTISSAIESLRTKLLSAINTTTTSSSSPTDQYSEQSYLSRVISGSIPLILTVHSADTISSILRLKSQIESLTSIRLKVILYGAAESHLLASSIAASKVSVVLAPYLPYAKSWDQRRSLTGAPLTNTTAFNILLDAGVLFGLGMAESWEIRDLGLAAGWIKANSRGKISEAQALALVGENLEVMTGVSGGKKEEEEKEKEWVIWEGSPLQIGARVRAVKGGVGVGITVWE